LTKSTVAGQDADPAWSPDGHWIAFRRRVVDGSTGGNPEVYLMGADGKGEPKRLTDSPADEQDPSWSRNGGQIAYKSGAMTADWPGKPIARAWIMRPDGSQKRVLWTAGADYAQTAPAWSRR
jgi:Tol biopolymer transport system component